MSDVTAKSAMAFGPAIRLAVRTLSPEVVARELRISGEVLTQLVDEPTVAFDHDRSLEPRIDAWLRTSFPKMLRPDHAPELPFDYLQDFWVNFYDGPPEG